MKYSLIIPTYNRSEEIKELIASLNQLDNPQNIPFELIIVDDGSTDDTAQFVQSTQSTSPFAIQYFHQKNKGPGAARNLGMENAKGDYFIFIDSDCIVPPQYLQELDQFIDQFQPDAFGGPDTYHPSFSPLLKAINYSMTSFIGTGGTRGSKKSIGKFYPRSFNMGFHKKVFLKIGGFNALRHGQDMDLSARIYQAGFKVSLIPKAFVYHKRRTSLKKFYKQIYNWGIARINLSTLHPGFLKPIHLAPAAMIVLGFHLLIFSIFFPVLIYFLIPPVIALSLIAFTQSFMEYKNLKVAFLSIITLFTQILAYGLGSLSGLYQRFILGKKESKGFTKNYYQ